MNDATSNADHGALTFVDIVRDVASDFGCTIADEDAEHILWNYTGFPSFWPTGRPVDDCVDQLDTFFKFAEHFWTPCARCGRPGPDGAWTCEPCDREMELELAQAAARVAP